MTTFKKFADRNRDAQDGIERHIYGEIEDVEGGGRIIKVKGTGTQDEEAIVMAMFGMGGKFPKDTNAEVHLWSGGADTNLKFAIVDIPHDKQRKWKEETNGVQKWDDPNKALEFNKDRTHLTDIALALHRDGLIEIKDGKIYVRCEMIVDGKVHAKEVEAPTVKTNSGGAAIDPVVPAFDNSNGTSNS